MFVLSSNQKGAIAETAIAAAETKLGLPVLKPITERGRYDLALEVGGRLVRVQCKWGPLDRSGAVIVVFARTNRLTPGGYVSTSYSAEEIDAVAAYCGALDRCYLLPIELVAGRCAIHLRVNPPLNGQRACIQLASNFELEGAVAQLEERDAGSVEVRGSSPLSSTSFPPGDAVVHVGSNEFRDHFGYYLERAAAGNEIHVTRHGRPYARLTSVEVARRD
jgi:prevent-host-death family protein